jgi:hypothetical protein
MKLYFLLLLFLITPRVWAYPNYIGHNYNSCINCHYNPFGGGQLTDYGRSIDATLISSNKLYPKTWTEEKIGASSGFLFSKPKNTWFRPQINYRGFRVVNNPGGARKQAQWINMQEDVRLTLKFMEHDKLIFVGDYGKQPILQTPPQGWHQQDYRSRNLYVGYRFTKKFGLYAGLMDKVYGIRVVEHIAFTRTNTFTTMNDQTYGVTGHYANDKWEGGVHAFIGNFNQDSPYRMKGASTMWERTVFKAHRLGASFMTQKNDFLSMNSYSVHGRFNFREGSALLAELGETHRTSHDNTAAANSRFGLLQGSVRPWRGVYFLTNVDYQRVDLNQSNYTVRWGPALQYFPIQRVELRTDVYDTRNFAPNTASKDSWTYLLQTHIWL